MPDRVDIDRLVEEHARRNLENQIAYHHDAQFRYQTRMLATVLHLVDEVLEHEGIPASVRTRVVRCVLYGSPNPADALLRIDQHREAAEAMAKGAPRPPVDTSWIQTTDRWGPG